MAGSNFSNRGHILASVGAAVGIANLVLFPARAFNFGGLAFIFVFVFCTIAMGVPLMIGETALGKNSQKDCVRAYGDIGGKKWKYAGIFGIMTGGFILSFYVVIAGWALFYLYLYLFDYSAIRSGSPGHLFGSFVTDEKLVLLFTGLFMALTVFIVSNNIKKGIEWVSKRFVPLLIVLMIFLIFCIPMFSDATMNYANFKFDFEALFKIDPNGRIGIIEAFGQSFFSLSLGACGMITYGTHVARKTDVVRSSNFIVHTDTIVALLGALLVIPLFTVNSSVSASPTLVFINLVDTFNGFGAIAGRIIGIIFFVLFNLAILTSAISLLEPTVNYLSNKNPNPKSRRSYALVIGVIIFIMCIPTILSVDPSNPSIFTNFLDYGDLQDGKPSMGYFNFILDFFGTFCILLGAFILTMFIRKKWKLSGLFDEIEFSEKKLSGSMKNYLKWTINWVIPGLLLLIFVGECIKIAFKIGIIQ